MNFASDNPFQVLAAKGPLRWLFLGDSITQGAEHTYGGRDYTQIFQERVRYELRRREDLVLNAAFDGATVSACLAGLERVLTGFLPEVAFVMIGTNDAADERAIPAEGFERDLRALVGRLREAGAQVILQTPCPVVEECAAPYRARFSSVVAGIRTVASMEGAMLVDHNDHWNSSFSANSRSLAVYHMCDGIHPNAFGHRLLARHLFQALGIFDPTSQSCRLFLP